MHYSARLRPSSPQRDGPVGSGWRMNRAEAWTLSIVVGVVVGLAILAMLGCCFRSSVRKKKEQQQGEQRAPESGRVAEASGAPVTQSHAVLASPIQEDAQHDTSVSGKVWLCATLCASVMRVRARAETVPARPHGAALGTSAHRDRASTDTNAVEAFALELAAHAHGAGRQLSSLCKGSQTPLSRAATPSMHPL